MPPGEPSFIVPAGEERSMFSRSFPTALSSSGVGAGPHSMGNLMKVFDVWGENKQRQFFMAFVDGKKSSFSPRITEKMRELLQKKSPVGALAIITEA